MTLVLELPVALEEALAREAAQLGEPVADYAVRVLTKRPPHDAAVVAESALNQQWIDAGLLGQSNMAAQPATSARFHLPEAVHARLQHLLDRQDAGTPLTADERSEAEGLVELAEFLSLLRLRALRTTQHG